MSLDKDTLTLVVGTLETLIATVAPESADNKNVTWSTGNAAVATVTNGVVMAVSAGIATITVTVEDGGHTATCTVTVTVTAPVAPTVTAVAVTPATASTRQFTAAVEATGGASETVTWSVTGKTSAATTISTTGLLTVAAGEMATSFTVTATSTFDNTEKGTATVTLESITSAPELFAPDVKVYPNPFTDMVRITGTEGCILQVINTAGMKLSIWNTCLKTCTSCG